MHFHKSYEVIESNILQEYKNVAHTPSSSIKCMLCYHNSFSKRKNKLLLF